MKLFLAEEMRALDAKAIKEMHMPELVLMENAGRGLTEAIEAYLNGFEDKQIIILAGKGNNGGDGLVAARLCANAGAQVTVVLADAVQAFSASTAIEYEILQHCSAELIFWSNNAEIQEQVSNLCYEADVVIDALLGTGFKGKLKGSYKEIIDAMPADAPVIAVDIPSGVEADTGKLDQALAADLTVTMIAPKLGLYLYPGAEYSGDVLVADLGTPLSLVEEADCRHMLVTDSVAQALLPKRAVTAHKGDNGRIGVIAGAPGYVGAAELASLATVRGGGGLVHLYTAPEIADIMRVKLTEVMVELLDTGNYEALLSLDALGVGPGLSKAPKVQKFLQEFLPQADVPKVIDADGLNAFVGAEEVLTKVPQKVLTPHPAELARLMGVTPKEIVANPVAFAQAAAKQFQAVVLVKTVPAMVATPEGKIYINTTGNEGMATGGCGDVLTGVITAFLGQGLTLEEAAVCGMFIHGFAGDLAAQKGKIGLKASDLLDYLPQAIATTLQGNEQSADKEESFC